MKGSSIEPRLEGDPGFLAKVLVDLGPESCDRNTFLDILQQLKSLLKNDVECPVALALLQMCTSSNTSTSGYSSMWNMQAFGSAVLESVTLTYTNVLMA